MIRTSRLLLVPLLLVLLCVGSAHPKNKGGGNYGAINIGPTGILGGFMKGSPHFTVLHVYKGSPADGKIQVGDVITSINGRASEDFLGQKRGCWTEHKGARYTLGSAITQAEAKDGVLTFGLKRESGDQAEVEEGARKSGPKLEPADLAASTTLEGGEDGVPELDLKLEPGDRAEVEDGGRKSGPKRESRELTATVKIPVLGAYSPTWPVNCGKSDQIVRDIAKFLRGIQNENGRFEFPGVELPKGMSGFGQNLIGHMMAGLFLLSTGEEEDLEAARKFAATCGGGGGKQSWYLGYRGLFLGEYYLRTGDETAKAKLAAICARLAACDKVGGWGHHLDSMSGGYVRGGLMNQAGVICFMSYQLARECGIEFDEAAFVRTLHFFYKFAGRGTLPYGDHRPGPGGPGNGRAGSTACAYSLLNDDRATRGAQLNAYLHTRTYTACEAGHTGNGFNMIWRGIAAPHVPGQFEKDRQTSMRELAWYYDLARGHDGSIRMLPVPNGEIRYASTCWGTGGLGLHYTAPRRALRITGKPRGEHNANPKLPDDKLWRGWEQPDTDFLKVGFCEGGSDLGIKSHETFPLLGSGNATIEQCEALMRHYNPSVRKSAAHALARKTSGTPVEGVPAVIDPKALDALERGLQHKDERVQRAACEGISSYHNWFSFKGTTLVDAETISERFAPYLIRILKDPESDIWAKDGALWVMARAKGETIAENLALIESFDDHELWWLRHSARWRVHGLAASEMVTFKTLEQILEAKRTEGRAFATVDLTKLLQMCVTSDKNFTPEQREEAINRFIALREMDRDGTGTTTVLKDAYGYAHQTSRGGMPVGNFYIFLNRLSPQAHIRTYPVLAQYLDDVSTPESEQGWGPYLFYGVKRFRGVMGKLMGAGEAARPIMKRLKQFLTTDDKAVARIKCEARKRGGGRKIFDPIVER
ncbi:MAG: DUF6288 domain-containing protein, partial [Kiritimatiellia bacterium]|nr:DUF6288 domain-containing protein [Kiritimatiellia bacterium]